jgi:hypothetical protein
MTRNVLALAALLTLAGGCGDDITNNNYYDPQFAIILGNIVPSVAGTTVSLLGIDGNFSRATDSAGYFAFRDLPGGVYDCIVEAPDYSPRHLDNLVLGPEQIIQLRDLQVSKLPFPIYCTSPAVNQIDVAAVAEIEILTDVPLVLSDLRNGISFDPPNGVNMIFETKLDYGATSYRVLLTGWFRHGTPHTITIDGSVHLATGESLGRDATIGFTTSPITAEIIPPESGVLGGARLLRFRPMVKFNEYVEVAAAERAISLDPAIEGFWLPNFSPLGSQHANRFEFVPMGDTPLASTSYTISVTDTIPLLESAQLSEEISLALTTEAYGVTRVTPENGDLSVYGSIVIELFFNTPMDTVSAREAFSLTADDGKLYDGLSFWTHESTQFTFIPDDMLPRRTVFEIRLTTDARLLNGESVAQELISYFETVWW